MYNKLNIVVNEALMKNSDVPNIKRVCLKQLMIMNKGKVHSVTFPKITE